MNSQDIAVEILTDLIKQVEITMISDRSPLTPEGFSEFSLRLKLANQLLIDAVDDDDVT